MTTLNIDTITAPVPIKKKLRDLSKSIHFDKQSRKGANCWLFFGTNVVHQQRVAVKFYDWSGNPTYHAEPRHLASLRAENVISVLDAALVDGDYAYFVTPYFPKGDLDEEIGRGIHGNLRAIRLTRDMLSGLSHLHAINLLHRDLKPQNILLSDVDHAIIGDFGSVKRVPDGQRTVPGSGHSLIYSPPESVCSGMYGVAGDLYQIGMVLYQMLGGALPYAEADWLNSRELQTYRKKTEPVERQMFANQIIRHRIKRGRILKLHSLPPWVCTRLRRTISKACSVNPQRRYQSCSEFLARIGKIRAGIRDWRVEDGYPIRYNRICYRVVHDPTSGEYRVEKRGAGKWRNDNSFSGSTEADLVAEIEERDY